jgi:tRNA modification GTPase
LLIDTIVAEATAPGVAGVAVVRVSGPDALAVLAYLGGPLAPKPRYARRVRFQTPAGAPLDDGLALYFPSPHSFTGEDVLELHLHGSRATLAIVQAEALKVPGVRLAEAGEFTKRALFNGKLDLTQAEALADLLAAHTDAQRQQALQHLEGGLSALYHGWRSQLIKALGYLEAHLDFPDEPLPPTLALEVTTMLAPIVAAMHAHLADARGGERVRGGVRVAIVGPPNAGKSTLLNALAERDIAITAPTPGTTRDIVEVTLNLGGYAVILADTAGIHTASDAVEIEGIRRAHAWLKNADVVLELRPPGGIPLALPAVPHAPLVAYSMADKQPGPILPFSAHTGAGMQALLEALTARIAAATATGTTMPAPARPRQRLEIACCLQALQQAQASLAPELAAEELRQALRHLGRLTGRVEVEEVLDSVFKDFCIGK